MAKMSGRMVSSYAGSRSSSHSRLDLLAEVAAGEAQSEINSWASDEGQSSSLGESAELSALGLRALKESRWDDCDLLQPACKKRRSPKGRVKFESASTLPHSASFSGLEQCHTTVEESAAGKRDKRIKVDRLSWSGELQDRFLKAVRHLGLKDAVPKDILKLMQVQDLTREQVASHLQKYRQSLRKSAAKVIGTDNLEAAQQRYMPGLPAIGVPCDSQMLSFVSGYGAPSDAQGSQSWPAHTSAPDTVQKTSLPIHDLQARTSSRASPEDPAFIRIRAYAAQTEAAMTAEFTYPAGPPVFIPPSSSSGTTTALPLLDIQPLKLPTDPLPKPSTALGSCLEPIIP